MTTLQVGKVIKKYILEVNITDSDILVVYVNTVHMHYAVCSFRKHWEIKHEGETYPRPVVLKKRKPKNQERRKKGEKFGLKSNFCYQH